MKTVLSLAFVLTFPTYAWAQGPSGNGTFSQPYAAPTWGHSGVTTWGSYSGQIGQSGWNYNSQLKPGEPAGSVLVDPNAMSSSFANPHTGATLFQPQDTRLKGRDRP